MCSILSCSYVYLLVAEAISNCLANGYKSFTIRRLKEFETNLFGVSKKVKVIPQQTEVSQGFPGRLRSRIFLTFGTTRVVVVYEYLP